MQWKLYETSYINRQTFRSLMIFDVLLPRLFGFDSSIIHYVYNCMLVFVLACILQCVEL